MPLNQPIPLMTEPTFPVQIEPISVLDQPPTTLLILNEFSNLQVETIPDYVSKLAPDTWMLILSNKYSLFHFDISLFTNLFSPSTF